MSDIDQESFVLPRTEDAILAHLAILSQFGGAEGVRDLNLLESAIARGQMRADYDRSADAVDIAASIAFGICRNHPFVDGNKRTALAVLEGTLYFNGYVFEPASKADLILAMAAGELTEQEFTREVRMATRPSPDHQRLVDMDRQAPADEIEAEDAPSPW